MGHSVNHDIYSWLLGFRLPSICYNHAASALTEMQLRHARASRVYISEGRLQYNMIIEISGDRILIALFTYVVPGLVHLFSTALERKFTCRQSLIMHQCIMHDYIINL
ncbi:hypothetical protein BDR05DRAFT_201057 [Suillus weaverae]|nr:hypothetical protein BDR05DRAFT_201057 [Suillus weaverae]